MFIKQYLAAFDLIHVIKTPQKTVLYSGGWGVLHSTLVHVAITENCTVFLYLYELQNAFENAFAVSTKSGFFFLQMRRQSLYCQVSTFEH